MEASGLKFCIYVELPVETTSVMYVEMAVLLTTSLAIIYTQDMMIIYYIHNNLCNKALYILIL